MGLGEPGTVSKTLPVLAVDNTVERDAAGRVTKVDRRRLLDPAQAAALRDALAKTEPEWKP